MKLTDSLRSALVDHILARFYAVTRSKGSAFEMTAVAAVFGVAALFGAGVPTTEAFLRRYWTTLGPVVYYPEGSVLADSLRVLLHEMQHVVQFWRDPLDYVRRYLTSTGRAELEAEAERAACEGWWILTGELPADMGSVDITRHGYALDDGHADLTRDLLEQAATSVRAGVISTDVGLAVLAWVRAQVPDAQVGAVLP